MNHSTAIRDLQWESRADQDARRQQARIDREAQIAASADALLAGHAFGRQDRGNTVVYPLIEARSGARLALAVRDRHTERIKVVWNETDYSDIAVARALDVSRHTGRGRAA